jgi:23S rRNA (uracil1939-C5)-methyltransferase
MTQQSDIITGEISTLAFGGEGILRHEGLVVFIPFTAPGDLITCRIISKKKSFARAELIEILKPSPQRTTPRCSYYGTCGGCQLQHLTYEAQIEHKRESVEDSLKRIGKLTLDAPVTMIPASLQWAYRRHVTLTLTPRESGYEAGYIAVDNRSVIPVKCCPIFVSEENPIIVELQTLVGRLKSTLSNTGRASILKQENEKFLLQFYFEEIPSNCKEICQRAVETSFWKGIIVNTAKESFTFGKVEAQEKVDNVLFEFSPRAFIQNHPEQSLNIYRKICEFAIQAKAKKILDLYCGVGISAILLTKLGITTIGVESNKDAIDLAIKNAKNNSLNVSFLKADVANVLDGLLKKEKPDFVVVNPPRIGLADPVRDQLKAHKPKHLVYISCNPTTLARDLQLICLNNYRIVSCEAFDMFPQTSHVETLVHLTLI